MTNPTDSFPAIGSHTSFADFQSLSIPEKGKRKLRTTFPSLSLVVNSNGSMYWILNYRFDGKQHDHNIGKFPEKSFANAETAAASFRAALNYDVDPDAPKRQAKRAEREAVQNNFGWIAEEFFKDGRGRWSQSTLKKRKSLYDRYVAPKLNHKSADQIRPSDVLAICEYIQKLTGPTGHLLIDVGRRTHTLIKQIFSFGTARNYCQTNPAMGMATDELRSEGNNKRHRAAATDPDKLRVILRKMKRNTSTPWVSCALLLSPYLFLRPGELRHLRWTDIDFANKRIFVQRQATKMQMQDLFVPLASQPLAMLNALKENSNGADFIFPSLRSNDRPISENTLTNALRACDISKEDQCIAGFRATAQTLIQEQLGIEKVLTELQLGHVQRGPNGGAYDRTAFIAARIEMMQKWAYYLENLQSDSPRKNRTNGGSGIASFLLSHVQSAFDEAVNAKTQSDVDKASSESTEKSISNEEPKRNSNQVPANK